jgi:2-C-methyl-D-erythritol 4-phosphate cytidylyltransferase
VYSLCFYPSHVFILSEWGMDGPRPRIEISELASALVEKAKQHKCSTFGLAAVDDIMCVAM